MKMKSCLQLVSYFGLLGSLGVLAENQHEIKRGIFPYMAFIYYSDPTVVDVTGERFIRSAVLIQPDWLVSSALGPSVIDTPHGFPKKTLLARVGAISIDKNFTLNEDEDEQEGEVIQIVRPFNHSATQWWTTDISLMKTLLPFNITSAVAIKTINVKRDFDEKTCIILVFARKFGNMTADKILMQIFVDLLPPSIDTCGSHFSASTMACAADSNENKDAAFDPDFCHGNSGGPLICENEVMGLQTYVDNNCKQPHLYQLLSAWDNFITCSIEDKCHEEQCGNICDVTYKDPPRIEKTISVTNDKVGLVSAPSPTEEMTVTESIITETPLEETTSSTKVTQTGYELTVTESTSKTTETTTASEGTESELSGMKFWPKEKTSVLKNYTWNTGRQTKVEAQQQEAKKPLSGSNRNICVIHNLLFGLIISVFL